MAQEDSPFMTRVNKETVIEILTRTSISFLSFCIGMLWSSSEVPSPLSFLISDSLSKDSVDLLPRSRLLCFLICCSRLRLLSNSLIKSGQSKFSCGSQVFSELNNKQTNADKKRDCYSNQK